MIRAALAAFRDDVLEAIATIRTGVDARALMQDVQFEVELRSVVGHDATAIAEARAAAIEMAKLGIRPEQLQPMAHLYLIADGHGVDIYDVVSFLRGRARGIVPPTTLADMTADELNDWILNVQVAFSSATGERARRRTAYGAHA